MFCFRETKLCAIGLAGSTCGVSSCQWTRPRAQEESGSGIIVHEDLRVLPPRIPGFHRRTTANTLAAGSPEIKGTSKTSFRSLTASDEL